jgi:hypothetical protein
MSSKDAYIKAGFKSKTPGEDSYKIRNNPNIAELIELKKAENTRSIDDKLAFEEEKSFDKLFEIRDLPLDKETYFAIIKSCVEIIDRRRGKAPQPVNHGGQDDNPIKHTLEIINASEFINNKPKEKTDDIEDD